MINSIIQSQIFVLDQDQALEFYTTKLGFEVAEDVDFGYMRWLTVHPAGQPDRKVLLERPGAPALDEDTADQVRELLTKGAMGGWLMFTTDDARATHDELVSKGVEITDGPNEQPYGIDFGIRDPFGNRIRIGQLAELPEGRTLTAEDFA
ncbi:MAG: VOC family protein [Microlunatus sp.]|nr:VOC family protein [Microlunatus sp.]